MDHHRLHACSIASFHCAGLDVLEVGAYLYSFCAEVDVASVVDDAVLADVVDIVAAAADIVAVVSWLAR